VSPEVPTVRSCPACGSSNSFDARFCSQCAAPLDPGSPAREGGERKQVTVLFSDLAGYTALTGRIDPEERP
jgi:class 3 adenylate cyclase